MTIKNYENPYTFIQNDEEEVFFDKIVLEVEGSEDGINEFVQKLKKAAKELAEDTDVDLFCGEF